MLINQGRNQRNPGDLRERKAKTQRTHFITLGKITQNTRAPLKLVKNPRRCNFSLISRKSMKDSTTLCKQPTKYEQMPKQRKEPSLKTISSSTKKSPIATPKSSKTGNSSNSIPKKYRPWNKRSSTSPEKNKISLTKSKIPKKSFNKWKSNTKESKGKSSNSEITSKTWKNSDSTSTKTWKAALKI